MQTLSKVVKGFTSRAFANRVAALVLLGGLMVTSAAQASWDYAKEPLFWNTEIRPNVALMIDDSGSMSALVTSESFSASPNIGTKWRWCTNVNSVSGTTCSSKVSSNLNTFEVNAWDGRLELQSFNIARNWTTNGQQNCSGTGFFKSSTGANSSNTYQAQGICYNGSAIANGDEVEYVSSARNGQTSLTAGVSYYVVNKTAKGFQLALTPGGAPHFFDIQIGDRNEWQFGVRNNLPVYIRNQTVALCNVASKQNYYIGNSGQQWNGNPLPGPDELGVMLGLNGSTGRDSCVRWRMASTARSTDSSTPAGHDKSFTEYDTSDYATHLLNSYLPASNSQLNLDSKQQFSRETIPDVNRMQAAREAAQQVIFEYFERMNIGLFSFKRDGNSYSGEIDHPIPRYHADPKVGMEALIGQTHSMAEEDLPASALDGKVGELRHTHNTPLAKTQHVINEYFKTKYEDGGPIAYRCQKNYAIVMTDGDPTSDSGTLDNRALQGFADLLGNDSGVDLDGVGFNADPDWMVQNIIPYTMGFGIENELLKRTPLVNRIAVPNSDVKNNTITEKAHGLQTGDYVLVQSGLSTSLRHAAVIDADSFKVANSEANAVTCAASNQNCVGVSGAITISTGPGKALFSKTPEKLASDLSSIFKELEGLTASASAVSANSKQVGGDTLLYQARFSTSDWSGDVTAYPISFSGGKASVETKKELADKGWTTKKTMATTEQRALSKLYTWSDLSKTPVSFTASADTYNALSAAQKASLGADEAQALNTITWLHGFEVEGLRTRSSDSGLLGDIINADPEYVGAVNFGYSMLPPSTDNCAGTNCTGRESYSAFLESKKTRTAMLFVGTNHGFMHALDASTGKELMGYVPAGVYQDWDDTNNDGVNNEVSINKFRLLTNPRYKHDFFIDGSSTAADAFLGSWKTYLVGSLGAGGRGVYALDITSATNFSSAANTVKWDISLPELGYSYGKPIITRFKDGNWYAVVANGLDSKGDVARVLLIDLASGVVKKIFEGGDTTGPNGMMAVQVRLDSTRTAVDIYAGDIRGNIWRFDVDGTSSSSWSTSGSKVYTAKDAAGNNQSITGGLLLGAHPNGLGTMVYFGTGKYFEKKDNVYNADTRPRTDAFYGILDTRMGNEVRERMLAEQKLGTKGSYRVMTASEPLDWGTHKGWFIRLPDSGERVVSTPLLVGGRIVFVSIVPSGGGSCEAAGYSWLNEVDALTGMQIKEAVLDLNNDGKVSADEKGTSAKMAGLGSSPGYLGGGGMQKDDLKYVSTTDTVGESIKLVSELEIEAKGLKGGSGRMSWQQLQ